MTDKNTCLTHKAPVLPSYRNQSIHLLYKSVGWFLNDRLNKTKKREIHEDRSHSYYYQIQLQLFVTVFFTYGLRRTCIRMPDETFWEIALPKSEVSLWTASFQNLLENFIQGSRKKKMFHLLQMAIQYLKQYSVLSRNEALALWLNVTIFNVLLIGWFHIVCLKVKRFIDWQRQTEGKANKTAKV